MSISPQNDPSHEEMDLTELSRVCGMAPDEILEYSRLRFVALHSAEGKFHADVHTLHRLRRISRLREDHEMKPPAIGFVLDLMDRLEAAERELRSLRERL